MPKDSQPLRALKSAFDAFYATLDAATVPDANGGRRVLGISHAIALSVATDTLYSELGVAHDRLVREHAQPLATLPEGFILVGSDLPDGPWTEIPADKIKVLQAPIGGHGVDPVLLAALESAANVAGFPLEKWNSMQAQAPGANHQRWHMGEVIAAGQLEILESARKLLELCLFRPDANGQQRHDDAHEKPKPKRGRRKADYETQQREAEFAADWKRRRDGGTFKGDYVKEKGITVKALNALLDRVAKRNRSSE